MTHRQLFKQHIDRTLPPQQWGAIWADLKATLRDVCALVAITLFSIGIPAFGMLAAEWMR